MRIQSVLSRGLLSLVACGALVGPSTAWAQCEAGQLTAPGDEGGNDFARGVAIDGDVAIVGDPVIDAGFADITQHPMTIGVCVAYLGHVPA